MIRLKEPSHEVREAVTKHFPENTQHRVSTGEVRLVVFQWPVSTSITAKALTQFCMGFGVLFLKFLWKRESVREER